MTQTSGNKDTVEAWAEIVTNIWYDKLNRLGVGLSGELFDSIEFNIMQDSKGNVDKVEFFFHYYGRFVDMGVYGGGERKAKLWFSKVYYSQFMKLQEILSEKIGKKAKIVMFNALSTDNINSTRENTKIVL